MKILVTGAAGFIGRHLTRFLAAEGHRVWATDHHAPENVTTSSLEAYFCSRLPSPKVRAWIHEVEPEAIVHCAGRAAPALSMSAPEEDFLSNTCVVFDLLEGLRSSGQRPRFVLLSSAAVYGEPGVQPIGEETATNPMSPYGFHKLQAEIIGREYAEVFGIPCAALRIFSAYGPGLRRQVVYDLITRGLRDKSLTVRGTGEETRDFIHVADICHAINYALHANGTFDVFNVASGSETSLGVLAGEVAIGLGLSSPPTFTGETTAGLPMRWQADITKLSSLGFVPGVAIRDGLAETLNWCKADQLSN